MFTSSAFQGKTKDPHMELIASNWDEMERNYRRMEVRFKNLMTDDDGWAPMPRIPPANFRKMLQNMERQQPPPEMHIDQENDQFRAILDVQQFAPEEITVKTDDKCITVEGKHEEKIDQHGYVSRQFVRRYVLPQGYDIGHVKPSLSSDGVLTITAPKLALPAPGERIVPIQRFNAISAT